MEDNKSALTDLSRNDLEELLLRIYSVENNQINEMINGTVVKNHPSDQIKYYKRIVKDLISDNKFYSYHECDEHASQIERLRESIEQDLLHLDPKAAWDLCNQIICNDGAIIESADDSDGQLGYELNQFCILWLEAADEINMPAEYWFPLVIEIAGGDDYGCRDQFLENTDILFNKEELILLYNIFRDTLEKNLSQSDKTEYHLFEPLNHAQQIAIALKDPELYHETKLIAYPQLNRRQLLVVIKKYIEFGKPEMAKKLLDERNDWDQYDQAEISNLYKEIFQALGDQEGLMEIYRNRWEKYPSSDNLEAYLELLDEEKRTLVRTTAKERAIHDSQIDRGINVLLYLKDNSAAIDKLISNQEYFQTTFYGTLLELLDCFKDSEFLQIAEIILNRALLSDILNRAYSKAYKYAAAYYRTLKNIDGQIADYPDGVKKHSVYMEELKEAHFRKRSFWSKISY